MRFAQLHQYSHLNSIIFLHLQLVIKHTFPESRRDSTAVIQIMTIVPGGSVRELIKVNKTIARFPPVNKVFFSPLIFDNTVLKHRRLTGISFVSLRIPHSANIY